MHANNNNLPFDYKDVEITTVAIAATVFVIVESLCS